MFSKAFEIFLNTLAYSFWPFAFFVAALYIFNRYFNDSYKKKVKKEKSIREWRAERRNLQKRH